MTPHEIAAKLSEAEKDALAYHSNPIRNATSGLGMGLELSLVFRDILNFASDGRLELTPLGLEVRYILKEHAQ